MSTLAKWVLAIVFLILVILIVMAARSAGDGELPKLCEKTGGLFGC